MMIHCHTSESPRSLALVLLERARVAMLSLKDYGSSVEDSIPFSYSFVLGLAILFQGQPCSPIVVGNAMRTLNRVLKANDLLGWVETCSNLRLALVREGRLDRAFLKAQRSPWSKSILALITSVHEIGFVIHPSPVFNSVVTFLGWLKRVPICIRPASEAVDEYYENDRRLSSINFDDNVYVPGLKEIWDEWLGNFKLRSPFLPMHGSGSTADCGRIRTQKWDGLSWDLVARVCLRTSDLQPALDMPVGNPSRIAKVVFVPKQAGKDRAICMEPAWLQYLQQGVACQLVDHMHHRSNPMSNMINIYSQERNRELCGRAYWDGLSTIDLSDASDSVSWRLLKRLCRGLPILRYLYGSRSFRTQIDGRVAAFDKFAPMGSALCFPIECIVFASIVELAYRIQCDRASNGFHSGIQIYGDDIICPAEVYHLTTDILVTLGFKVNTEKSYSSGNYYESCGMEYLYGALIKTIKHPRSLLSFSQEVSPEQIGLVSDLANNLLDAGYTAARIFLLKTFEKAYIRIGSQRLPFMESMEFGDGQTKPSSEPYTRRVWSDKLQASGEVRTTIEAVAKRAKNDYRDFQSRNIPLTRSQRISRKYPKFVRVHEKWSQKAVTFLSKFRHFELLETGDLQVGGSSRTGRVQYKVRRKFRT